MFCARRWCFTICVLFMLCPRRYRVDAVSRKYLAEPLRKPASARWSMNIVRDKVSATSMLKVAEPGFDFSEDEMVKLKIWRGGVIPYYIDEFSFDKVFRDRIRTFLDTTNSITGLNFIELHRPPEDENTRWVLFVNRQGLLNCADHPYKNFTNEGVQRVVLGYDCLSTGGELAETVLALVGVPPQHNAPNRDLHVTVYDTNIIPDKKYLFEILKDNEWLFHGMDYDYHSASHYPPHKYTVNGMATLKPLHALDLAIGEGKGFSYTDVWKIRMLYNFISKKRFKTVSVPECNKLFNMGSNFSNPLKSVEDVVFRKKPNKYLGLPDDASEGLEDLSISNANKNSYSSKENVDKYSGNEEEESTKSDDANVVVNRSDETQEAASKESVEKNENNNRDDKKLIGQVGNDGNKLLLMSDYASDDNAPGSKLAHKEKNRQMKFVKPPLG